MAIESRIQVLRGTTALRALFTPLAGELIFDTDSSKAFIGDGSTAGGLALGVWSNIGATADIFFSAGDVHIGAATNPDATLQVTGSLHVTTTAQIDGNLQVVNGQAYTDEFSYAPVASPLAAVDFDNSNSILLDLSGMGADLTITAFSNGNQGGSYLIKVLQGATARDVTWPGSVVWLGNEPTLSDDANGFNILTFYYDGTNYIGTGDANIDGGGFT